MGFIWKNAAAQELYLNQKKNQNNTQADNLKSRDLKIINHSAELLCMK